MESWLASVPGRRTANAVLQESHWIRSRPGMSGERAKRNFWRHPGQVTVKDEAVAEGWLIIETIHAGPRFSSSNRICRTFYLKMRVEDLPLRRFPLARRGWLLSGCRRPDRNIPAKELDDGEDTAFSVDPVDLRSARLLLPGRSPVGTGR
jgi:hypothetical protein